MGKSCRVFTSVKRFLSSTMLVLLCFCANPLFAEPLTKIVVFGDSLSDNGNLYAYMKQQLPMSPPYFDGRFSNGYVWAELLAKHYFSTEDWQTHFSDYAFGGAGVLGPQGDFNDDSLLALNCEVDSYLLAHQDQASSDALFVVWIGANNYLTMPDDKDAAVEEVSWGIKTSLQRLVDHGAKHILLLNLPDLGATPLAREFETQKELTEYSDAHNALLAQTLERLKAQYTDVQWLLFDISDIFHQVLVSPQEFGFTNVTDTCYESVMDKKMSHGVLNMVAHVKPKMKQANLCDGYFFFDPLHPSATAHQVLAEKVASYLDGENVVFLDNHLASH